MRSFLQRVITVAICFVVLGRGIAAAQSVAVSQVSGIVVDSSAAPLPGATVTMKKTDTGQTRVVVTGSDHSVTLLKVAGVRNNLVKWLWAHD